MGLTLLAAQIGDEERKRGRGHAVNSARLANGPRLMGVKLGSDFVRKPWNGVVTEVMGEG